ncbi:hypothetical protein TURU_024293 [Turdus rufiventris]|nr:hypothetical protein TURU_024293 [Turdus rufiventris]
MYDNLYLHGFEDSEALPTQGLGMPAETISWQTGSGDGSQEYHFLTGEKPGTGLREQENKQWWNSGSLKTNSGGILVPCGEERPLIECLD